MFTTSLVSYHIIESGESMLNDPVLEMAVKLSLAARDDGKEAITI
jgi:hypothetical protein